MKESEPVIRSALETDYQAIVKHYGPIGDTPWSPFSSIERIKQIPTEGMLVAEVDGVYAGFLYWFRGTRRRDDFGNFNYAQILNVSTVEGFNRGKVLLNLIGRASKDIEDAGIGIVYVQTDERSKALIRMYEDVGYTTYARTLHLRLTNRETREPRERTHQENMELAVFMVELKEQCRALLIAYEELNEIIDLGPPSELEAKRTTNSKIWSRLQSIMATSAVISKLLWPNPSPRRDGSDKIAILRSRVLRSMLGIETRRSLIPKEVRNSFEHVDERLIDWLPTQQEDLPLGWVLSPFKEEEKEPPISQDAFRYYNLYTHELRVAGSKCNLEEVVKFVREIESHLWPQAQVFLEDKGNWDPVNKNG